MTSTNSIFTADLFVSSDTPGIELHIRNKRLACKTTFGAIRTIVLMHGAAYSSCSLYDTAIDGYSFMDFLATAGFDVYGVDVRGYGASSRPAEMAASAGAHGPLVRTDMAIRDFGAAVDHVLERMHLNQVNLVGMAWGGAVAGAYTSRHGGKVRRLGLIAPQWVSETSSPSAATGPIDAWRVVDVPGTKAHWLGAAPAGKRADLIPTGGFDAWVNNTVRDESDPALRKQQSIRVPNGAHQDTHDYWHAGLPLYHPDAITVPVLLVHGEWDAEVPLAQAQDYFAHLTGAPHKRWIELGEATHMLVLEKTRRQAFTALSGFMQEVF
jgi:pimeloyl-ACP methyl ester carboxylesterase